MLVPLISRIQAYKTKPRPTLESIREGFRGCAMRGNWSVKRVVVLAIHGAVTCMAADDTASSQALATATSLQAGFATDTVLLLKSVTARWRAVSSDGSRSGGGRAVERCAIVCDRCIMLAGGIVVVTRIVAIVVREICSTGMAGVQICSRGCCRARAIAATDVRFIWLRQATVSRITRRMRPGGHGEYTDRFVVRVRERKRNRNLDSGHEVRRHWSVGALNVWLDDTPPPGSLRKRNDALA